MESPRVNFGHRFTRKIDRGEESLPGEKAADRLQFANARDRLSGRPGLEIAHRQVQEVREQALAELDVHAIGRVGESGVE